VPVCGCVAVGTPGGLEIGAEITSVTLGRRITVRRPELARADAERPQQRGERALRQLARVLVAMDTTEF